MNAQPLPPNPESARRTAEVLRRQAEADLRRAAELDPGHSTYAESKPQLLASLELMFLAEPEEFLAEKEVPALSHKALGQIAGWLAGEGFRR